MAIMYDEDEDKFDTEAEEELAKYGYMDSTTKEDISSGNGHGFTRDLSYDLMNDSFELECTTLQDFPEDTWK